MERSRYRRNPTDRPVGRSRLLTVFALTFLSMAAVTLVGGSRWPVHAFYENRLVSPFGDDLGGTNDCTSPDQPCKTIQQAVNQSGSGDLIELAPGTYTENVSVSQSVTIQGDLINGSTVDGNQSGSVFSVGDSIAATFTNLTITNGRAIGGPASPGGGGIVGFVGSTLTVIECTITGNHAINGSSLSDGGGIDANGPLTLINSTVTANSADNDGGGVAARSTTTIVNSTITANGASTGGGIFTAGVLSLTNTIIAGSTSGGDCVNMGGTIATNSHNLIQDGSCSPAISGDPKLGPPANNGGPTFTRALLAGSPAINAGDDTVLGDPLDLATDQRGIGFPRLACTHVDIGAFEFGSSVGPTVMCPGNISTTSDPGLTTANVSFTATASDPCDGALTPVCTVGGSPITSPHAFPVGTTTVTCSATDSAMLTGMCSFNVTVSLLNVCIQDVKSGDTFRFNSTTGAYIYTRCKDKFTLSGTGKVSNASGVTTLTDSQLDRRITASFNNGQLTGKATIILIKGGVSQQIILNSTNPHPTCTCPV